MTDEELPAVAMVLTKVAMPEALAAAAAMKGLDIDAVPTAIGCVAVCRSAAPGDPEIVATNLSGLVQDSPVVLLIHREGQISASRWQAGEEVEELSAALMLDGAPAEIEDVLLDAADPRALPGVVSSVGMSRWRAMRVLAAVARVARKEARATARDGGVSGDPEAGPQSGR